MGHSTKSKVITGNNRVEGVHTTQLNKNSILIKRITVTKKQPDKVVKQTIPLSASSTQGSISPVSGLLSAIADEGKAAAGTAMELMGYSVEEEAGWVVKKDMNGTIEKIEKIK